MCWCDQLSPLAAPVTTPNITATRREAKITELTRFSFHFFY